MPRPFSREFREVVIRVARNRDPGVRIKDVAADFGISEGCLTNWLSRADVEDGIKPRTTTAENAELRAAKRGSGCSSRRTRCCAVPPRTCRRRTCRETDLPARP
jgi:transposase-like protein